MKITEDCINHNVERMINEIISDPYEYSEQSEQADRVRLMTLGHIKGILEFAEAMKVVLKA